MTTPTRVPIDVLGPDVYRDGDPDTNGLPLDLYARLRDEAPCHLHTLSDPMLIDKLWVVSRYEDIVRVDKDHDLFVTGGDQGVSAAKVAVTKGRGGMIYTDGTEHVRHRSVARNSFSPKVVKTYGESFRKIARHIVAGALAEESFDFVPKIAIRMPLNVICELLDVPAEERSDVLAWLNAAFVITDPAYSASPAEMAAALENLGRYSCTLADRERKTPRGGLMSQIVGAVEAGNLSEAEIQGYVIILAAAGADTTRNTFSHALHQLMRDPDQMASLREHADDIPRDAVQEIIRWGSAIVHFGRTATADTEIAGQEIRAGEFVAMLFPSGNFDPSVFDDPATMDLTRSANAHLSFGVGPHACLGRHVAALEIKILFEELLQATSSITPTGPIAYARDSRLRGVSHLPVRLTPA
jgi:cholest-4-en-3-one 26-monooxygenase